MPDVTTTRPPAARLSSILVSYVVLVAVAFVINVLFGHKSLLAIALDGRSSVQQLGLGVALAVVVATPVWSATLFLRSFASLRKQVVQLVQRLDISGFNPIWIGILAGVGEEVLFRGALQPIIGLWWSSIIFVALHFQTYQFRTFNWQKGVFAAMAFLASLLLGKIFYAIGLIAAVACHAAFDILGLFAARRIGREQAFP